MTPAATDARPLWSWAVPLALAVLTYGLAAGIWKHASLSAAQFCVLFAAVKLVVNLGGWALWSRRPLLAPEVRSFAGWCLLGHLVNGLAWIAYFAALASGPVSLVQTLTASYTALATLLAVVFLRERVVGVQVWGVALAVAAAMLLGHAAGGSGPADAGSRWFWASLLAIAAWGAAVVLFKHAYRQPGADDWRFFAVNAVGMVLTVLPYGALSLVGEPWSAGELALGVGIVALYAVGDLALFAAIHRGPAAIVSPLSGLYPIPTLAYGSLVLGERIGASEWTAIAMVLAAIVLLVPEAENPVRAWVRRRNA